ncbi:MAG: FAD-binding oxidoreductase [Planctomycetes bacterium]|nr:FAD-binding oxidoreductase [Planctomycetota bacterium]
MRARLVIIGSGTTGLCVAHEAARRTDPLSSPVLLLAGAERTSPRLELCRHDLDSEELALEVRQGLRFWSGLRAKTGRDPGWNPCGAVVEVSEGTELSSWERLHELGAALSREGDKVFDDDAGTLDAECARSCLEALARDAGAVVRTGERALSVRAAAEGTHLIETSAGEIIADDVVIAGAGACSLTPGGAPSLVRRTWSERAFGGESERGEVRADEEGEPLVLEFLPSGELDASSVQGAFEERFGAAESESAGPRARVQRDLVAAPERGGRLWVGGADDAAGDRGALAARALGDAAAGEERERALWEGPDGAPIIGAVPGCERVWLACGFGARANLLAPACAETLSAKVLEGGGGWFARERFQPPRAALSWRG